MDYNFSGVLYKGKNTQKFDLASRTEPTWFALDENTIDKYGQVKYMVDIKQSNPVKLLNITTWEFRQDLFNKLNTLSLGDSSLRRKKALTLMALGLPSLETQIEFMKLYLTNIPPQYKDPHILVDTCTLIGHRLSETKIDLEMVSLLKILYGNIYNGYIQPYKVVSCWMNEFAPEVCLFDLSIIAESFGSVTEIKKGGGRSRRDIDKTHICYYKLNDKMFKSENFKKNYKNTIYSLLRYDGYTDKESNEFSELNYFPSAEERQNRITSIPDVQESKKLQDLFDNSKIDFISNAKTTIQLI
jgi:hypothetical protein